MAILVYIKKKLNMEIKEIKRAKDNILPFPKNSVCLLVTGLIPEATGHFMYFFQTKFVKFCLRKKGNPALTIIEPKNKEDLLIIFNKKLLIPLKEKGPKIFIDPNVEKYKIEKMINCSHNKSKRILSSLRNISKEDLQQSRARVLAYNQNPDLLIAV